MTTRDATRDRYLSVFSILFTLVTSVISENIKRVIERIDRENRGVEEENIKNSYGFSSKSLVTLVTAFFVSVFKGLVGIFRHKRPLTTCDSWPDAHVFRLS